MKASNLCEEESQDQEAFGGAGEKNQWLITLVALLENLCSVTGTSVE